MEFDLLGELLKLLTKENIIILLGVLCIVMFLWNLHIRKEVKDNIFQMQKATIKFLSLEERIQRLSKENRKE